MQEIYNKLIAKIDNNIEREVYIEKIALKNIFLE